jgi:cytochrome c-type biogenesis protein CcmH
MLMILLIVVALMTAGALFAVLWPLRRASAAAPAGSDSAVYRDQLHEIERDLAAGSIGANEAQAARIEVSRRLLAADEAESAGLGEAATNDHAAARNQARRRKVSAALALIVLTLGAGSLYLALGSPGLPGQPLAERMADAHGGADSVHALFARVEAHLEQHPEDGRGWEVIAPVYMRLGRYADAAKARANALRQLGATAERQADFGEALVAVENGTVTSEAKTAFDAALRIDPGNVTARFYEGLAAEQDGKSAEAASIWRAMLDKAPETAAWVATVRQALARVEHSGAAGAPSSASGPNSAAGSQSDQNQMIRAMVERLAARLRENGSDADGWVRLVRSYMVLGEREKAQAALADAQRALQQDPDKLRRFEDGAKSLDSARGGLESSDTSGATAPGAGGANSSSGAASDEKQMIRGMVERLAARLHQDGSDVEGWVRLVRSYLVLGDREKAQAAFADARRALKDDPDKLRRFEDGAKSLGING